MREIEVQLFAGGAALAGVSRVCVHVDDHACVSDVREALRRSTPELEPLLVASRWATGTRFVEVTHRLDGINSLAMIPPVSGG